jgi:hypothetical protein
MVQQAQMVLLWRILHPNTAMTTEDVQEIMQDAACLCSLTTRQVQIAILEVLLELLNGGGISGQSCLLCDTADPVLPPACDCAIHYRTDNGAFWFWNGAAWIQFLAP